jgi:hypothetical protein
MFRRCRKKIGEASIDEWRLESHGICLVAPYSLVDSWHCRAYFGSQKSIAYLILLVFSTVFGSCAMLWMTGTALEEAQQERHWFFSAKDLVPQHPRLSWNDIYPPRPMGSGCRAGEGVNFGKPLSPAFLPCWLWPFCIWCNSVFSHSAALKKNIPNLTRKQPHDTQDPMQSTSFRSQKGNKKEPLSSGFIFEH